MSPVSLATLTLADLEGTGALESIRHAASLRGVTADVVLAEVTAEPLTIDELTMGLQIRADGLEDAFYAEQPGLFSGAIAEA